MFCLVMEPSAHERRLGQYAIQFRSYSGRPVWIQDGSGKARRVAIHQHRAGRVGQRSLLAWVASARERPGVGSRSLRHVRCWGFVLMLKSLPSAWTPWDITWCLNVVTLPITLVFKRGPWIVPSGHSALLMIGICVLGLLGNALAYASFRYLELSTASAFVPSSIIWGVLLDISKHSFPAFQGIAGCFLYLFATVSLVVKPKKFWVAHTFTAEETP